MDTTNKKVFGNLLLEAGLVTESQLLNAIKVQKETGERIGEILIRQGVITNDDVIQVLEFQVGVPHINLNKIEIRDEIIKMIPEKIVRHHHIIPITIENNKLIVALTYPFDLFALDDVRISVNMELFPKIATIEDINAAIEKYYPSSEIKSIPQQINTNDKNTVPGEAKRIIPNKKKIVISEKAKQIANEILIESIANNASDIHIEPHENEINLRFRINGSLKEIKQLDIGILGEIVAFFQEKCDLEPNLQNKPQNGVLTYPYNNKIISFRISNLPTIYGEKLHIQQTIVYDNLRDISKLGLVSEDILKFYSLLENKSGLILISGPIGSGISTTFYSVLKNIKSKDKSIISIENLCEIKIEGVTQIDMSRLSHLNFSDVFNSVLKQDPDIIAVGEINDITTAELAINAASLGYLVIATINAKDSINAVLRIIEMGISPLTISNSLLCVTSQRLVRGLCSNCCKSIIPSSEELDLLKNSYYLVETDNIKLSQATGCKKCKQIGYLEKIGVFELLNITPKIREAIFNKSGPEIIKKISIIEGLKTIKDNSLDLALTGRTTLSEIKNLT